MNESPIPPEYYICLSIVLFSIGAFGVLIRRNLVIILLCLVLMLNAATLGLITFARYYDDLSGQVLALFILVIVSTQVVAGLAMTQLVYRQRKTVNVSELRDLHS